MKRGSLLHRLTSPFIPNIRYEAKIFSGFPLNPNRLFVTIVWPQNIMELFNTILNQFDRGANVGNLISVLIIVIILLLKPEGAIMV